MKQNLAFNVLNEGSGHDPAIFDDVIAAVQLPSKVVSQ
jgi:hypothetical protein